MFSQKLQEVILSELDLFVPTDLINLIVKLQFIEDIIEQTWPNCKYQDQYIVKNEQSLEKIFYLVIEKYSTIVNYPNVLHLYHNRIVDLIDNTVLYI